MPPWTRTDHPTPVMQTRSATRLVATIGAAIGLRHHGRLTDVQHSPATSAASRHLSAARSASCSAPTASCDCCPTSGRAAFSERYGTKWPFFASVLVGLLPPPSTAYPPALSSFCSHACPGASPGQGCARAVTQPCGRAVALRSPNRLALGASAGWAAPSAYSPAACSMTAGYGAAITAVAAVGLLAIPTAYLVRWPASVEEPNHPPTSVEEDNAQVSWRQLAAAAFRSPVHRWLTLGSFFVYLLSGVVVSTTSVFLRFVSTPVPAHSSSA